MIEIQKFECNDEVQFIHSSQLVKVFIILQWIYSDLLKYIDHWALNKWQFVNYIMSFR